MASDLGEIRWYCINRARTTRRTKPRSHGRLRDALAIVTAGFALHAPLGHAQLPPSVPAADAVAQPTTQVPTQTEMDNADLDPDQWLTDNKGYLGYRYSTLAQLNAREDRTRSPIGTEVAAKKSGYGCHYKPEKSALSQRRPTIPRRN